MRRLGYARTVATLAVAVIALWSCHSASHNQTPEWAMLHGYWEGRFMPESGLDLILVLHFDSTGSRRARVLLWQDGTHVQDDPLSRLTLSDDSLQFLIRAKDTPFYGTVDHDQSRITGRFRFPDGVLHPVSVERVEWPSLLVRVPDWSVDKELAVEDLQQDLDLLFKYIAERHPDPFRFTSKAELSSRFAKASEAITSPLTSAEFLRIALPLVASVRCAHTDIRLAEPLASELRMRRGYLPFEARIVNGEIVVEDGAPMPPGSSILSINDVPSTEIVHAMLRSVPRDGLNETYPLFVVNEDFVSRFATVFGLETSFKVEFENEAGEVHESVVAAAPLRVRRTAREPVGLHFADGGDTAVLTVHSMLDPTEQSFSDFLGDAFRQIHDREASHLIIDLRGSTGGYPPHAALLLSYLIEQPVRYFEGEADAEGDFAHLFGLIEPQPGRFLGDVTVLANGANISSAGHFLSLVRYHGLATIIGEESGGSFRANGGGTVVTLPASRLEVFVPQREFRTAVTGLREDRGIEPDIQVTPGLTGKDGASDPVMLAALSRLDRSE